MVSLLLGNRPDPIHKIESFLKIWKLEGATEVVLIDNLPVRHLGREIVKLTGFERRHIAFAGNAGFAG
jgi:hypothetical protein